MVEIEQHFFRVVQIVGRGANEFHRLLRIFREVVFDHRGILEAKNRLRERRVLLEVDKAARGHLVEVGNRLAHFGLAFEMLGREPVGLLGLARGFLLFTCGGRGRGAMFLLIERPAVIGEVFQILRGAFGRVRIFGSVAAVGSFRLGAVAALVIAVEEGLEALLELAEFLLHAAEAFAVLAELLQLGLRGLPVGLGNAERLRVTARAVVASAAAAEIGFVAFDGKHADFGFLRLEGRGIFRERVFELAHKMLRR